MRQSNRGNPGNRFGVMGQPMIPAPIGQPCPMGYYRTRTGECAYMSPPSGMIAPTVPVGPSRMLPSKPWKPLVYPGEPGYRF